MKPNWFTVVQAFFSGWWLARLVDHYKFGTPNTVFVLIGLITSIIFMIHSLFMGSDDSSKS